MTMIEKVSLALKEMGNCTCRDCLGKRARAAIEAMREPTEAMTLAPYGDHDLGGYDDMIEAADNWRAMIDAALEESSP